MLHDAHVANLLDRRKSEADPRQALIELAVAFNARHLPEEAATACAEILRIDPASGEGWFENVIAHSFGGPAELEGLRDQVVAQVRSHPDAAWAHRNLGLVDYYLEHDVQTRRECEAALALDPADSHAHEVLAYLAYTVGDLDAAIESAIQAVELQPRNFRALHWLGECYLKLDAEEQAVRYFHRALRIEQSYFFALESLGAIYLRRPDSFAEAWQCFARMLSINPRYFPVYFRLADAFIQAERLTEAAAQAEAVLHLSPDRTAEADAHQYLGLIELMRDDRKGARARFEHALALDPRFAAAHHYLGVASEQDGDLAAAESCYRRAVECDPEYALPHVRLGYLCFDRKEYENARRHFEAALRIDDRDHVAHLGLGEIARWRRDYVEQLERCRHAVELAPDDGNARNQLGTAYDALGDSQRAVEQYEAALRLDPYNRQAANNLGYLYERQLKEGGPDAPSLRERAIHAWKRRLLICRDTRSSTRGAKTHLARLGVPGHQIDEWLEHGQVA